MTFIAIQRPLFVFVTVMRFLVFAALFGTALALRQF